MALQHNLENNLPPPDLSTLNERGVVTDRKPEIMRNEMVFK